MTQFRYDVNFRGRVQGVFFRATTQDIAAGFAVTGWVKNESDGSVQCVAEGDAKELDAFIEAIKRAKRDNITDISIDRRPATGEFTSFEIRY